VTSLTSPPPHPDEIRTHALQVELTKGPDEYVRFGDVFQLENLRTGAVISVDAEARDPRPAENACAVSASFQTSPCARNTFTLERYAPTNPNALHDAYDDDLLHYGQKVKLVVNPAALEEVSHGGVLARLKSFPVSQTHFSKLARECEYVASWNDGYECVFQILTPDPTKRLVSEGVAVMAGAPIVMLHCNTNQLASVSGAAFENDFGQELEVSGKTAVGAGNSYVMEGIATGKPQSMSQKAPQDVNVFTIVSGATPAATA